MLAALAIIIPRRLLRFMEIIGGGYFLGRLSSRRGLILVAKEAESGRIDIATEP